MSDNTHRKGVNSLQFLAILAAVFVGTLVLMSTVAQASPSPGVTCQFVPVKSSGEQQPC